MGRSLGYLFREGIKSLWKNRTMSIASIAVLISCLLLTGVAAAITANLSLFMETVESSNTITVYLEDTLPSLTAVKVGEEIRALDNIAECTFVPKDTAISSVIEDIGGSDSLSLFEGLTGSDNPLPDAYTISLNDLSLYDETIAQIEAIDGVDSISDYSDVATKLSNFDRLVRYCSVGLVAVLALVSLFIISNTVKVTMFSRRMEISIMKSVGATNSFVRFPFMIEGILIGVLSGVISATVLYFAYDRVAELVINIVTFMSVVDIHPYVGLIYISYILVGILFGMLGSVISIGRYLKREGEDAVV